MEIFNFLLSINKIAVFSFLLALALVIYEIYLLIKQSQQKKIVIPNFENEKFFKKNRSIFSVKKEEKKAIYQRPSLPLLFLGISLLIVFGFVLLIGSFNREKKNSSVVSSSAVIKTIASSGIKIYNLNWQELNEEELKNLKPGDKIIIGIKTIPQADIDKARIKINKDQWQLTDETEVKFNKNLGVFFREYQIASGEHQLKIEAQLHSVKEGWLGE